MSSRWATPLWTGLALLLGLALWLTVTGRTYLDGVPEAVLEKLAQGRQLVPPHGNFGFSFLLGRLPFDPLLTLAVFQSLVVSLAFLLLWLSLRAVWRNPVSPTLTAGLLFFGSHTLWMVAGSPEEHAAAALKALAVACLVSGKVPLLCGVVMAIGLVDPASGMAFFLALSYLAYKRQEAYGIAVCLASVVGSGAVVLSFLGDFILQPSLQGLGWWSLWPLLALLNQEMREARAGLYLTLLAAAVVTGTAEVASAVAIGDGTLLLWRRSEGSRCESAGPGEWRWRLPRLFHPAALLMLVVVVLPGEQYLNRRILIPAQKSGISLLTLFRPFSLTDHARALESQPWRTEKPFAGMSKEEVELLGEVAGPFRLLTAGSLREERRLALLYALLAGQPLAGWDSPSHLSSSSLVCKVTGRNVVVGPDVVLFRDGAETRLDPGPEPAQKGEALPAVDFRRLLNVPFRVQTAGESGGAYLLKSFRSSETLVFEGIPAVVVLSSFPQTYHFISPTSPERRRELVVNEWQLQMSRLGTESSFPSRSLLPLQFKLYNRGQTPVSTDVIESVALGVAGRPESEPIRQQLPKSFILYPEEAVTLTLQLATPPAEGRYDLAASFKTSDGSDREISWEGETEITTWRRLPPVEGWMEEPRQP